MLHNLNPAYRTAWSYGSRTIHSWCKWMPLFFNFDEMKTSRLWQYIHIDIYKRWLLLLIFFIFTLTVSIVGHLDLQSRQTGVPVELTVVPVGFAIAATHWPLVGFAALEERKGEKKRVNSRIIKKKDKIPQQCAGPHLYAQAAGLALLVHSTLPAGPAEHVGAHFALAVHLLKERTAWAPGSDGLTAHTVALLIRSSAGLWEVSPSSVHRWRWISQKWSHFKEGCNQFRWKAPWKIFWL